MKPDDQLLAQMCRPTWRVVSRFAHQAPSELDAALGPVLAMAVHTSRASVLITDAQLDAPGPLIVYVNPAFEAMSGYTAAEVVGRNPRLMQGPATDRRVLDRLRDDLENGRPFEGETVNYRSNGEPFIMSWRIGEVRGDRGEVTHYVAIQDDVTDDRLRRHRENRLVNDLQMSLLPDLPSRVGFLDVAAAYRPAAGELPVGGDWYDAITGDGYVDLVVGDVAGHGVEAVAEMGRLRWTVNALLAAGSTPSRVASTIDASLDERGAYATLAIARVYPDRAVEIVSCGAPAPVVVGPDASITYVGSGGPLLGLRTGDPLDSVRTTLPTGHQLLLYSDGLSGNGRLDENEITERLSGAAVGDVRRSANRLCELGADDDDTAVLAVELPD